MNQLKGIRKADDCILLVLFAEECYHFKFAKEYNMGAFKTKEEFVEKYTNLK